MWTYTYCLNPLAQTQVKILGSLKVPAGDSHKALKFFYIAQANEPSSNKLQN